MPKTGDFFAPALIVGSTTISLMDSFMNIFWNGPSVGLSLLASYRISHILWQVAVKDLARDGVVHHGAPIALADALADSSCNRCRCRVKPFFGSLAGHVRQPGYKHGVCCNTSGRRAWTLAS